MKMIVRLNFIKFCNVSYKKFVSSGRSGALPLALMVTMAGTSFAVAQSPEAVSSPAGQPAIAGQADAREQEAWQAAIRALPAAKPGCFEATFPSKNWTEVSCGTPSTPPRRHFSDRRLAKPLDESASGDYAIQPSKVISSATGALPFIENVTSVTGFNGVPNEFSLQLNTNSNIPGNATGSLCPSNNKACTGWLQFEYDSGGSIEIQSWHINYASPCPNQFQLSGPQSSCGNVTARFALPIPLLRLWDLAGATLTGQVFSNGLDSVTFTVGGHAYTTQGTDVVGAFGNWTSAEFNVVGEGGGDKSIFNNGSLVAVALNINNDNSGVLPKCIGPGSSPVGGTTGESTNLTLGSCSVNTTPGIVFVEGVVPTIDHLVPASGPDIGGTSVTIVGSGFNSSALVRFGSQRVLPKSCTSSACLVTSPAATGIADFVDVTVANLFNNGSVGPFSTPIPADRFTYQYTPKCSFAQSCPFYQNQPPTYQITCAQDSDFYLWSGVATIPTAPPLGELLVSKVRTDTGSMTGEDVNVAACVSGTKDLCTSYSIGTENWCYSHKPLPPPPMCSQCGSKKCCPDPHEGRQPVCVSLSSPCPPLQ
jgi:IPT/TIG domain-containing protein